MQITLVGKPAISTIYRLAKETWINTYVSIIGIEQVNYMLQLFYAEEVLTKQMDSGGYYFILICHNNDPIGFASWSLTANNAYKLHKLYVLPRVQGSGAGSNMIKYIINHIKTLNGNLLTLNVNRQNQTAIRFYYKQGFTLAYNEDIDIGQGFFMNDHVMQMHL